MSKEKKEGGTKAWRLERPRECSYPSDESSLKARNLRENLVKWGVFSSSECCGLRFMSSWLTFNTKVDPKFL